MGHHAGMDARQAVRVAEAIRGQTKKSAAPTEVTRAAVRILKRHVPIDAWCAMTLDPATLLPTGGYHEEGLSPERMPRLLEIEYGGNDVNLVPHLLRTPLAISTIGRATGGDPKRSARYRDVMVPDGMAHELRVVLKHGKRPWGVLILFRAGDATDFDATEVKLVASISPDLARAFKTHLVAQDAPSDHLEGPGLIMIEGHRPARITSVTNSASRWLSLVDDMTFGPRHVPAVVLSVAERARHRALADDQDVEARSRIRTRDGRWMTLHATVLDLGSEPRIAVIVEPSRPAELAALIVDAHGLTTREREVCELLLHGLSNKEISRTLSVSPFTVQDYVKKIFAKLSVGSRGELTSKLFFDYYMPRLKEGQRPASSGWFATPRA